MSETFSGINTLLRGLEAQQTAMDVTGHNIANASTPGYSRQIATLETTDPVWAPTGAGELGTGVQVGAITRAHDAFAQQQIVYQNGQQGQQQTLSDTLNLISQVFNDPSSQGFSTLLSNFFTSWQQLANNPSDASTRAAVVASGEDLATGFAQAAGSLRQLQANQDTQVVGQVQQANGVINQIAALNQQIMGAQADGQNPNDLEDKRDALINQLSGIMGITQTEMSNGAINISLTGGGALVQGASTYDLATSPDPTHPGFSQVTFANPPTPVTIQGGTLGGALQARDSTIASRLSALDSLANAVATAVNGFQQSGYGSNGSTGIAFFTGATASTIAVNATIQADPSNVAASAAPNEPGDGSVALKIAQLQETPPPGGTVTIQGQYGAMISQLGMDAQQAATSVQTGTLVLQQLTTQQEAISSVSLNEEATNLMQYQSAYGAAGRAIAMMNQAITDMINSLGG